MEVINIYTSKVSSKGWVVIPKELRKKYNINEGDRVVITEVNDMLAVYPLPRDPISSARGIYKGYALTKELLKDRKEENKREEEIIEP